MTLIVRTLPRLVTCALFLALLTPFIRPAPGAANGGLPDTVVTGSLGRRLDLYLTRLAPFGFSGAILVAKGNDVILYKAYGLTDRQNGVPNTTRTVFDIASLSKQFTAAAILKLEAQGKLKTDDPISRHLPGVPEDKQAITVHHLLTHTCGLAADLAGSKNLTREQFVAAMLRAPLTAPPGKRYLYANSGYNLLAAIVEVAAGQPFHQYMADQLFKPAGLGDTGFYDQAQGWGAARLAHGYNELADNGLPTARPPDWGVRGAYDVLTTVGDLYRWGLALRDERVLPATARRKLFAPRVATGEGGSQYSYGWLVSKYSDDKVRIHHGGSHFDGFNSSFQHYPEDGLTVIILTNRIFGRLLPTMAVEPALNEMLFGAGGREVPEAGSCDPRLLKQYAGAYQLPSGARFAVTADAAGLVMAAVGQEAVDLLIAADGQQRRAHREFNDRAAAIFNGVGRDDPGPLVREFTGRAEPEQVRASIGALWRRFEEKHGAFKSVELLGTVPEVEATMTYVRLNFERGGEYRRCRWEGGKLAYILQGGPPFMPTTFVPRSGVKFVGYHPVIGRRVDAEFAPDGSAITFKSGGEKIPARRTAG